MHRLLALGQRCLARPSALVWSLRVLRRPPKGAIVYFNAAEARMLADLTAAFGHPARAILQVHRVRHSMELGIFIPRLQLLASTYDIAHSKLPDLLCEGVASGLLRECWHDQLDRLVSAYSIARAKLPTLLCNNVASSLLREGRLDQLDAKLPTLLCNGVASGLLQDRWLDQLDRLGMVILTPSPPPWLPHTPASGRVTGACE